MAKAIIKRTVLVSASSLGKKITLRDRGLGLFEWLSYGTSAL